MDRETAVAELARHGIRGEELYLVDLVPLLEVLWADGKAQKSEVELLDAYLKSHVARVNALVGHELLTVEKAHAFVLRYLEARPDPALLKTLRGLVAPARLQGSNEGANELFRDSLLKACLDIASAAVREYPYGLHDRFDPSEKRCYFEIADSLQ